MRRGKTHVEKRDGLVFCSGWMDGTFVHAAEWMDGATNRHQPQARLYAAAKVRQLRIFFSSSSPRTNVQGGANSVT